MPPLAPAPALPTAPARTPGARFEAWQRPGEDVVVTAHDAGFGAHFGAPPGGRLPPGTGLSRLIHADDHAPLIAEIERAARAGEMELTNEFRVRTKRSAPDGEDRWLMIAMRLHPGENGGTGARSWSGLVLDATQRKRDEKRIYHLAYFDTLTNLPNRRLFIERAGDGAGRAAPAALLGRRSASSTSTTSRPSTTRAATRRATRSWSRSPGGCSPARRTA